MMLTIFYDGYCPLCLAEMKTLQVLDVHKRLQLEDIYAEDFNQRFPNIDIIAADRFLHGQLNNGEIITGLDVTCLAWKLVGKHSWLQVLRWPGLRFITDVGYRVFARYRHQISALVTGKSRCIPCQKNS